MDTDLPVLRTVLVAQFSLGELRALCHDLGVNHEELTTGPLGDLARELVEHCRRRDRIADLVAAVEAARPGALAAVGAPRKPASVPLPLDHIPAIAPLPRGSRMPFRPNPSFVGRDEQLCQLAAALAAGGAAAIGQVVAATGLGGIGKTSLAAEFAHRYGQYFSGGVFWLSFAESSAIPSEIAACGGPEGMNLAELAGLTLPEQAALVQRTWREATPRLLVFDNCEDEELFSEYAPTTGGCAVLITSRYTGWSAAAGVTPLVLDVLPRADSLVLLRRHRPELAADDPALDAIARELGDLPLALHLAGSFLETYRRDPVYGDPARLLAELRDARLLDHEALQGIDVRPSPTNHDLHVGRTLALSLDRLDAADPSGLARALLARAACFAPGEPIPRELLLSAVVAEDAEPAEARRASRALARLQELGLLTGLAQLIVHRLVARLVASAADREAQIDVEQALLAWMVQRYDAADYYTDLAAVRVHLEHVATIAMSRDTADAAWLCHRVGAYLRQESDYTRARPYSERALAIRERLYGPEHLDTARSLNSLGNLLQAQGELDSSRLFYERALAIRKRILGLEHKETAQSLNNLGVLLHAQGYLAEARQYHEQALGIRKKVLEPDHPDIANSLNNLGGVLQAQGEFLTAHQCFGQALAIYERGLGAEHPNMARTLSYLGSLLQAQGDLAGARVHYERSLAIRERVLGPEHPDTASSLNNLGMLFKAQGDLAGARVHYERSLAIRERVLGPEHPDTATSLNNLGGLLYAQGDLTGARPYLERSLAIREQVLGSEHPNTARSLNNLGLLLQAQGDLMGARPYLERALAIWERVLGLEHRNTRIVRANLAALLPPNGT